MRRHKTTVTVGSEGRALLWPVDFCRWPGIWVFQEGWPHPYPEDHWSIQFNSSSWFGEWPRELNAFFWSLDSLREVIQIPTANGKWASTTGLAQHWWVPIRPLHFWHTQGWAAAESETLVPWPGIELWSPGWKPRILTTTPGANS